MKPIYFKLESGRSLIVVPETQLLMDGHPILSLNYNIFNTEKENTAHGVAVNDSATIPDKSDPNYLGFISFEHPGKMYTYTSENDKPLNRTEVEETIELISHIRDNSNLWQIG